MHIVPKQLCKKKTDNLRAQLHGQNPYNVSWMMEKPQAGAHM